MRKYGEEKQTLLAMLRREKRLQERLDSEWSALGAKIGERERMMITAEAEERVRS